MEYYSGEVDYKGNTFYFEAEYSHYREEWGADADGNRGVIQDVLEIHNIDISDEFGNLVSPNRELETAIEEIIAEQIGG